MSLTSAQAAALKTAIQGDATVAAMVTAHDWPGIAANYNAPSSPSVFAWNNNVRADYIISAIVPADLAALTVQQTMGLLAILSAGFVDASNANVQTWFTTLFNGKATTLAQLTTAGQTLVTKFQALFTTSNVCSLYGYQLSNLDVQQAMGF